MKNGGRNGMKNGVRDGMENEGRNGMKKSLSCQRNGVLKRRAGFAVSDTLSSPTEGQKNGEKIKPKNGENFGTKTVTGKIFVPAWPRLPGLPAAGHLSQSLASVARLAARARQLCDPG